MLWQGAGESAPEVGESAPPQRASQTPKWKRRPTKGDPGEVKSRLVVRGFLDPQKKHVDRTKRDEAKLLYRPAPSRPRVAQQDAYGNSIHLSWMDPAACRLTNMYGGQH